MKKLMGLAMALFIIIGGISLTACASKKPEVVDGAIYVTETKSFWSGFGTGYISFEYLVEPAEKATDDTNHYGYVFKVMVLSDSDVGYTQYMDGVWELEQEGDSFGTLTLTGYWDETIENPTSLADAKNGEAKTYEPTDGKYTIGINIPSAGTVDFVFDPAANKIGEGGTAAPQPEVTQQPELTPQPEATQQPGLTQQPDQEQQSAPSSIQLTITADATSGNINTNGKIDLYADSTWKLLISYDGGANYTETASGTWALNGNTSLVFTVVTDTADVLANETYDCAFDTESNPGNIVYNCAMLCNVPQVGELNYNFTATKSM